MARHPGFFELDERYAAHPMVQFLRRAENAARLAKLAVLLPEMLPIKKLSERSISLSY
jgi:hypothetical protein